MPGPARTAPPTASRRRSVRRPLTRLAGDQLAWKRARGRRRERILILGGFICSPVEDEVARASPARLQRSDREHGYGGGGQGPPAAAPGPARLGRRRPAGAPRVPAGPAPAPPPAPALAPRPPPP